MRESKPSRIALETDSSGDVHVRRKHHEEPKGPEDSDADVS